MSLEFRNQFIPRKFPSAGKCKRAFHFISTIQYPHLYCTGYHTKMCECPSGGKSKRAFHFISTIQYSRPYCIAYKMSRLWLDIVYPIQYGRSYCIWYIAQLVEHRTGNAEVADSNPVEALIFSGFFFPVV